MQVRVAAGYSGCEIDWGVRRIGGRDCIVPTWYAPVPVRRFRINAGALGLLNGGGLDELRLITDYRRPLGDQLRTRKWFILRRSGTSLARAGLMRIGAWPAMGKRYGFRDWVIWMEKFGQPTPIASYGEETDEESKAVAAEIIRSLGEPNGAIKPKSIEVEFAEAKRFGDSGSVHQAEIDHCNAEMSKLVNGSTLTNDNKGSGGASYALGSVHDGVRWEAVQHDAERLETAFETDVSAAFVAFNDLRCAPPKLKIQVVRDLDPMTRVQVASKYKNELGGKISGQQMGQELGFREPSGDGDDLPGIASARSRGAKTTPDNGASGREDFSEILALIADAKQRGALERKASDAPGCQTECDEHAGRSVRPHRRGREDRGQQPRALEAAAQREIALPAKAFVVGEPVTAAAITYSGHPRAGLTLCCTRGPQAFRVGLADVAFRPGSWRQRIAHVADGARFVSLYRAWLGLGELASEPQLRGAVSASRRKVTSGDIAVGEPIELVQRDPRRHACRDWRWPCVVLA